MRIRGPIAFLFLIGLAGGSWWLASRSTDLRSVTPAAVPDQPGYYLRAAVLDQTDVSGRRTLTASAERATQDPAAGVVRLEQLVVDYFPQPGRDWVMTSAAGSLPAGGRVVELQGDVRLQAAAAAEATGAVVRTEHLRLDLDSNLATTADPVRIELAPYALDARGLRADLKRETLTLESTVNGTFPR